MLKWLYSPLWNEFKYQKAIQGFKKLPKSNDNVITIPEINSSN